MSESIWEKGKGTCVSLKLGLNLLQALALRLGQSEELENGNDERAQGKEPIRPVLAHCTVHVGNEVGLIAILVTLLMLSIFELVQKLNDKTKSITENKRRAPVCHCADRGAKTLAACVKHFANNQPWNGSYLMY